MNNFDFTFQDSYTGFWDIEGVGNHIAGTLFLHDSSIELDLFYEGSINVINEGVNDVKGQAFSKDADGKERAYDFVLYGLCIKKCTGLRNINHYIYDVEYFYLYQKSFSLNEINSACIRTPLLDKWSSTFTKQGYKERDILSKNHIKIEYLPKGCLTLYRDKYSDYKIYIYCGFQTLFNNDNVSIQLRNFLNVDFGKTININEAYKKIEIVKFFFFLVWNIPFSPSFIEFRTPSGDFIQKLSKKYSFEYIENYGGVSPHTTIDDFGEVKEMSHNGTFFSEPFENSISNWFKLYSNHKDALDTYFDTISNKYIMPSIKIKNFISTIDALSENVIDEIKEDDKNDGKQEHLENIFKKLNKEEVDFLKKIIGKKRKKQQKSLRDRFMMLLKCINNLLPNEINREFVDKIVNTRNNITHPKEKKSPAFEFNEYEEAAFLLTKVIRAYLLQQIDIKPDLIRSIVQF